MKILLAEPRGFCAGVERAVDIVERALKKYGAPVYVRHEIVHNKRVVKNLEAKGAIFVDEIDSIPKSSITIFSAHGVSKKVELDAEKLKLSVLDATCPLVNKVHVEAQNYHKQGYNMILIGHMGHPEVEGINGRVPGGVKIIENEDDIRKLDFSPKTKLAYVTQTTLSVDDTKKLIEKLKIKYPNVKGPNTKDICYATQNRQIAVRRLASKTDLVLVIGSNNSSNTYRLFNIVKKQGVRVFRVSEAENIKHEWFVKVNTIGITAGASSPEELVQEVINKIKHLIPNIEIEYMKGIKETVKFKLPKLLL